MQIDTRIRALVKKNNQYNKRYNFYWTEKDGKFKIIAEYGAIYDLILWAQNIWGMECNKSITALDEDGNIAYFIIGGRNGQTTAQPRLGT